jgi:long-subunit acyl-CoA synthetase (AMP-forming)
MRAEIQRAVDRVRAGGCVQDGPVACAVRARWGLDAIRVAIAAAAPCPADVVAFWHAVGVPLGEVDGMFETGEPFDAEGWLHAVDIGMIDVTTGRT